MISKLRESGGTDGAVQVEDGVSMDAAGGDKSARRSDHSEVGLCFVVFDFFAATRLLGRTGLGFSLCICLFLFAASSASNRAGSSSRVEVGSQQSFHEHKIWQCSELLLNKL